MLDFRKSNPSKIAELLLEISKLDIASSTLQDTAIGKRLTSAIESINPDSPAFYGKDKVKKIVQKLKTSLLDNFTKIKQQNDISMTPEVIELKKKLSVECEAEYS